MTWTYIAPQLGYWVAAMSPTIPGKIGFYWYLHHWVIIYSYILFILFRMTSSDMPQFDKEWIIRKQKSESKGLKSFQDFVGQPWCSKYLCHFSGVQSVPALMHLCHHCLVELFLENYGSHSISVLVFQQKNRCCEVSVQKLREIWIYLKPASSWVRHLLMYGWFDWLIDWLMEIFSFCPEDVYFTLSYALHHLGDWLIYTVNNLA